MEEMVGEAPFFIADGEGTSIALPSPHPNGIEENQ